MPRPYEPWIPHSYLICMCGNFFLHIMNIMQCASSVPLWVERNCVGGGTPQLGLNEHICSFSMKEAGWEFRVPLHFTTCLSSHVTLPFFSATVAAKLKLRAETFYRLLLSIDFYHGYRELKLKNTKQVWQSIPTTQDWVCDVFKVS